MEPELIEIRDHLSGHPPFDALPDELIDAFTEAAEVGYFRAGTPILEANAPLDALHYIRSGAVEVYRQTGDLYDRLGEGDIFGHYGLIRGRRVHNPAVAIEDTLIYFLPADVFETVLAADAKFADYIELGHTRPANDFMAVRVRRLIKNRPSIIAANATAQMAAQQLNEELSDALLVTQEADNTEAWDIIGIVTDADFRQKIVAEGRPNTTPVGDIASERLVSIRDEETVQEALLTMLRHDLQHLLVVQRGRPHGLLRLEDIIRYQTQSSLFLVDTIFNQTDIAGLAGLLPDIRAAAAKMLHEGAESQVISMALSALARSTVRRIVELSEADLGPAPIPYAVMIMGSMARDEQTLVTDQDNALVLDNHFDAAKHADYFTALAHQLCDGLNACGYAYCKGNIMATNERWRQPLAVWQRYFKDWMAHPTAERLLHSNIFFDLDVVAGESDLIETLQTQITTDAANYPAFLAAMARNALNRTPPLGFFRGFVTEKDGQQNNSINVKRRGTAPLTDLIRLHALACGSLSRNSFDRLKDISETQILGPGVAARLEDALETLSHTRLAHQVIDIEQGREPDNNIEPEHISAAERARIKQAFRALSHAQKFLRFRYPMPTRR